MLRCPNDQISAFEPPWPGERIARRGLAVGRDAKRLAHVPVHALRMRPHHAIRTIAGGDVEHPIGTECQPAAEVVPAVVGRQRLEDHAHLLQRFRIAREHAPRHAGRIAAVARLGKRPVDRAIGFERGAEGHVEQAALPARGHRRQVGERLAHLTGRAHDAHAPGTLGDEEAAVGRGSIAHGCSRPRATTVTSKATVDLTAHGARLSLHGGLLPDALGRARPRPRGSWRQRRKRRRASGARAARAMGFMWKLVRE
jgi:hypothetical protein